MTDARTTHHSFDIKSNSLKFLEKEDCRSHVGVCGKYIFVVVEAGSSND